MPDLREMGGHMKSGTSILMLGALLLASCGGDGSKEAPKGQVVATVDGKEITAAELRMEMQNVPADPKVAQAVQEAALQRLINRKLLAAEATKRELEKSPLAAMYRSRAEEQSLVDLLQMTIASGVPKVSDDEVNDYVSSHPTAFSQRRLVSVEQLLVPEIDAAIVKRMEPINTMPEIEALLNGASVKFVRSGDVLDTLSMPSEAAAKIAALKVDEIFVIPTGAGAQVARVISNRVEPLAGEEAQRIARSMLSQQRGTTQVGEALKAIVAAGQSKVKINADYKPKTAAQPKADATGKAQ